MKQEIFSGDLFSRSQEINALISKYFRNLKLYRMRLVSTQLSIFDDHPNSDQLELFEKAMQADMDLSSLRRQLVEWQCVSDGRSI